MAGLRIYRTVFLVLLSWCVVSGLAAKASAQSDGTSATASERASDVDIEVQLHLLVASNVAGDNSKLSAPLESVARDLRPLLPFTNYRLGATFLARVKNGRPLEVKGVGRTLLVTPALEASVNPTFYEINAGTVSLKTDAAGREVVQLFPFRFGLRIPLQGTAARGNGSDDNSANILYEGVGIKTDVSMREGEPVVVGTLDAGRPNETLVLVLIAKRAAVR